MISMLSAREIGFNSAVAISGTLASAWLGGWDSALKTIIVFMIIDYISGILSAAKNKKLNSDVMFWGGIRKGAILVVIAIAVLLDELLSNQQPIFRTMAIWYYVSREGLSVVENLGKLGVPLPPFIKNTLEQIQSKSDEK